MSNTNAISRLVLKKTQYTFVFVCTLTHQHDQNQNACMRPFTVKSAYKELNGTIKRDPYNRGYL